MILWADGFDHYGATVANMTLGAWAAVNVPQLSTTRARTGTRSLLLNIGTFARRVFGAAKVTAGCGAAFWFDNLPGSNLNAQCFSFRDSGNAPQLSLFLDTTGVLSLYRGSGNTDGGTLLASSTELVSAAAWNHIEMKATFDNSAGSCEVRLNGVTVINVSGVDTVNNTSPALGENSASQITLRNPGNNSSSQYIDDVVCWDSTGSYNNDFLGDQKVFTDMPNADGADQDWTPSSGSDRYAMVDEIPQDGDSTYDETLVTGDRMGVTFPALDSAVVTVAAVYYVGLTRKTDAGTCNVQLKALSGGAEASGVDTPITTVYTYRGDVFEEDPDTLAPWTPAAASAAALVVERTA